MPDKPRFFEVRSDLRKVIERGIQDNLMELALRGKPRRPFYMVGRVDGQSVVMQTSKGKLVMTVGDKTKITPEGITRPLGIIIIFK